MPIQTAVTAISTLLQGIKNWDNKKQLTKQEQENKTRAIGRVMNASIATKAYLSTPNKEGHFSGPNEKLALSWQEAATAIHSYDNNLYNSSRVKALGYADPKEWEKSKSKAITVELDKVIEQCEYLLANLELKS